MPLLFAQNAQALPPQIDVTLLLAIAALVLAIVTLILDFAFFVLTWRGQVAFAREMNQRQDRLTARETELFVQMSTVLAQVSERARIVQEQVDKQMVRLTDYVMGGATATGAGISAEMQQAITRIEQQIATIGPQSDAETVASVRRELTQLSVKVERLPEQLALSARQSMNSINDERAPSSDDESFAAARFGRATEHRLLAALRDALDSQQPPESGSWMVRVGDLLEWVHLNRSGMARHYFRMVQLERIDSQAGVFRRLLEQLALERRIVGIDSRAPDPSDWLLVLPYTGANGPSPQHESPSDGQP
jgi:hypothetical protein